MPSTTWASREDALASSWAAAKDVPPAFLDELLEAATEQAAAYAPAPALDPVTLEPIIPARYRLAVIYQARELWAAAKRDGDVIAGDAYVIRARDLTATVRQLLRPTRGRPRAR